MGLFLSQEAMWDRPLGGTEKKKQVPHWFGNIAWAIVGAAAKIVFRYRVDGRQNLRGFKGKSGVVVVCNHTSFLDVAFIYFAARPWQWARVMGRDNLFVAGKGLLGQILSRVGGFPVKRDEADRLAIKRATKMLKDDEIVVILPEGTRRGKGTKIPKIHAGASFIARMGHAPILPMTVRNAEKVKQKGKRLRFPQITIEYGTPILVGDFDFLPKEDRLEACSWYAMRQCFALNQNIDPEEVDMVALFPEQRDFTEVFREHPIPTHSTDEVAEAIFEEKSQKAQKKQGRD